MAAANAAAADAALLLANKNNNSSHETFRVQDDAASHSSYNPDAKILENTAYIGFNPEQFTSFPGFVEATQLLGTLSNKMGMKSGFLKYWIRIIRSEASSAILLDTFWWFYLTFFDVSACFSCFCFIVSQSCSCLIRE